MFQPPLMFTVLFARGRRLCVLKKSRCDERRRGCPQGPLQRGRNMRRGWRRTKGWSFEGYGMVLLSMAAVDKLRSGPGWGTRRLEQ